MGLDARRLFLILSMCLLLAGCVSEPSEQPVKTSDDQPESVDGIYTGSNVYFYGRFCGPNWPKLDEPNLEAELTKLQEIKPVDKLDNICKAHDVCYAKNHYFSMDCDNIFSAMVRATNFNSVNCRNYAVMLQKVLLYKPAYRPVAARPGVPTLFGYERVDIGVNLIAPIAMIGDGIILSTHGFVKPQPGSC